jgi:hypothetical protein
MEWAALIAWVLTASGGFLMLGLWLKHGGQQQRDTSRRVIRPPLIFSHFGLAATGLVLWIIYVASDSDAIAWIAFALLVPVALLGFTMFARWLQERQSTTQAAPAGATGGGAVATGGGAVGEPAEQHFPVPVVAIHGLLAVTTVVLVLLAAAGVGD